MKPVPDVKLCFFRGWYWLVVGEGYQAELLAGTLPPERTVEIVDCADFAEVEAAWEAPMPGTMPWQIHPNIGDYYRETRCGGKPKEERKRLRAQRDLAVRGLPLRDA